MNTYYYLLENSSDKAEIKKFTNLVGTSIKNIIKSYNFDTNTFYIDRYTVDNGEMLLQVITTMPLYVIDVYFDFERIRENEFKVTKINKICNKNNVFNYDNPIIKSLIILIRNQNFDKLFSTT